MDVGISDDMPPPTLMLPLPSLKNDAGCWGLRNEEDEVEEESACKGAPPVVMFLCMVLVAP